MSNAFLVGVMQMGPGVPKDEREAVKWWTKSAGQGQAYAQLFLGECYEQGKGVNQDLEEAAKWYIKAATQGLKPAKLALEKLKSK